MPNKDEKTGPAGMTVEKAVELGWEFEDRAWPRAGCGVVDIHARKGGQEFSASFHRALRKTDRPRALHSILLRVGEAETDRWGRVLA